MLDSYGWERAVDTSSTWRLGDATAPFYNYIYYTVAGFTEHDTFRSNQIREGGNIKDQLKSGSLASNVINALSKNLDRSVDLKKQIDAAILKGEIEKDINKTKLTSFQEQIKFIKENVKDSF